MKILFLHNNFPAQFGVFGHYLAERGWDVAFATQREDARADGLTVARYKPHREPTAGVHPYAAGFERSVLTGQGAVRAAVELKKRGLSPDVIVAHSGWGPGFYMKDVWPNAAYLAYFEWYYTAEGPDVAFLADAPQSDDARLMARSRNASLLMDLANCDWAIAPTQWQKQQIPKRFHPFITVQHDGIDTDYFAPVAEGAPAPRKHALGDRELPEDAELITYVARGMEPYRGFPQFMAALEKVLKARPKAHAIIVGADRVAYGAQAQDGASYKEKALAELDLDLARIHFTDLVPRPQYRAILQSSSVHVYLTVPFVLSWSFMEAMSAGCAIIASDTAPVREVMAGGVEGVLVDFFDTETIAERVIEALEKPHIMAPMRAAARAKIVKRYAARDLFAQKEILLQSIAARLMTAD